MSAAAFMLGLGLGGVALALVLARRSSKETPTNEEAAALSESRAPITTALWTPQTPQDVGELLRTACDCVDAAPHLEDEDLVLCVWRAHWQLTDYPGQAIAGDHASVQEALDAVRAAVQAAREGQCERMPPLLSVDDLIDDVIDEQPHAEADDDRGALATMTMSGGHLASATNNFAPLTTSATGNFSPLTTSSTGSTQKIEVAVTHAPIDMVALTRAIPTPGYFYQAIEGERFLGDDGILARALYQAVLDAAKAKGWSTNKAQARAAALAADVKARVAYLSIVQCGPWNDAMYGTWGYGEHDLAAAHGRAIRLIARHDRVYDRLAEGQAPIRTLDRGVPSDKGKGTATGAGDMPELLWLPPLRSDALLDANRSRQVVAEGLVWADGSSKYNPPPAVQELGIENAPAGPWGCKGIAA